MADQVQRPVTQRPTVTKNVIPVTHVFQAATIDNGAQTGTALTSRFTGQGALGVTWRF